MKFYNKLMAMVVVALTSVVANAEQITHTYNFDESKLIIGLDTINHTIYSNISYDGIGYCGEIAEPRLPCKCAYFCVPYNACDISVTTSRDSNIQYSLNRRVIPIQDYRKYDNFTEPNDSIYNLNENLPLIYSPFDYINIEKRYKIVAIPIIPVQYNPTTNRIIFSRQIGVTINYTCENEELYITPVRDNIDMFLSDIVENSEQLLEFKSSYHLNGYDWDNPSEFYNYKIITTEELKPAFNQILALKRQKGYQTEIITMEEIAQYPTEYGSNALEKFYGIAGKSNGYLLFGGAPNIVPSRKIYTDIELENGNHWFYSDFCFTNSMKLNKVTGEDDIYTISMVNKNYYWPTYLYVGRLTCNTQKEIENYSQKLISYELNLKNKNYDYQNKHLSVSSGYLPDWKYNSGSCYWTIEDSNTTIISDGIDYPTGKDIIDTLNNNAFGVVEFAGPSCPAGVTVKTTNEHIEYGVLASESNNGPYVVETGNCVRNINNYNLPFAAIVRGARSMPFDYQSSYNLGQAMLFGGTNGAVAYVGNSGPSQSIEEGGINELFNKMIGLSEQYYFDMSHYCDNSIGCSLVMSKFWFVAGNDNVYYSLKGLGTSDRDVEARASANLLGDPELHIRYHAPYPFDNLRITNINDNQVLCEGLPSNVFVSYTDNKNNTGRKYVKTGTVNLNVPKNSCLMVWHPDYQPFIAPLCLQNDTLQNNQYVFASDVRIGYNVDANRTSGNLIFSNGITYEIEANGDIYLEEGTILEPNATLNIETIGNVYINNPTLQKGSRLSIRAHKVKIAPSFSLPKGAIVNIN